MSKNQVIGILAIIIIIVVAVIIHSQSKEGSYTSEEDSTENVGETADILSDYEEDGNPVLDSGNPVLDSGNAIDLNVGERDLIGPSTNPPSSSSSSGSVSISNSVSDIPAVSGQYIAYSDSAARQSAQNGDAVLFFHAKWCPTCRSLDKQLKSSEIPDGLSILKVDYDNSSDLKRKYNIRYQHTLVLVDANLNPIKSWSGSRNLSQIYSQLQ